MLLSNVIQQSQALRAPTNYSSGHIAQFKAQFSYSSERNIVELPEGTLSDVFTQPNPCNVQIIMGLGASEFDVSPRMIIQIQEFCTLVSTLKSQGIDIKAKIFTALELGLKINGLPRNKVIEKTQRRHEYLRSFIDSFFPHLIDLIDISCDAEMVTDKLYSEISLLTDLFPLTKSLRKISSGRSSADNAKIYALFHALQLGVCNQIADPKKTIIVFGAASEHNFVQPITLASKLISDKLDYQINNRVHVLMPFCKVPAYYPLTGERTLGDRLTQNFIQSMASKTKVKHDYKYLNTHKLLPFFIEHFNFFHTKETPSCQPLR